MNDDLDRALDRLADFPDLPAMAAVAASAGDAEVSQLARLTWLLADSGERLGPPSRDVVDIASSGGPGSLSTLLAPLYARALGVRVAKIAVPGRPAGGLDVLASLPGYDTDLDAPAARRVLDDCGYVHVAAGGAFCPLDARFFAWRQANGAQAIPNLAITSLLAKKLAAGVGRVVLDIRVGAHGNFGATAADARPNATRLVAVAAELGIRAICVLTVSSGAAQPWIGRGEALVALASVLAGTADGALNAHAQDCLHMAGLAVDASDAASDRGALAPAATSAHEAMLAAHGTDPQTFWSRQRTIATVPRHVVTAEDTGRCRSTSVSFVTSSWSDSAPRSP
ncbi:MAG: pdp [Solirubrobacterales bacterium]|nr:pdp [Solirubrobacterales bacterium]